MPPLVELLRNGSAEAKLLVATALGNFSFEANEVLIAEAGGIPPLVELLREGSADAKVQAARALGNLARNDPNRVPIMTAEAGGVPPLVELLRDGRPAAKTEAVWALFNLARNNDANAVAIAAAVGLEALVQLARRGRVTVDDELLLRNANVPAKRKAALVVAALLRDCVPVEARSQVRDLVRGVIGPYL